MKMRKTCNVLGIVLGIVLVILGLHLANGFSKNFNGIYTNSVQFNGDFYTSQYEVTKNVSDNIDHLGNYLNSAIKFFFEAMGMITAVVGAIVSCYFGSNLEKDKKNQTVILDNLQKQGNADKTVDNVNFDDTDSEKKQYAEVTDIGEDDFESEQETQDEMSEKSGNGGSNLGIALAVVGIIFVVCLLFKWGLG